MSLVVTITVDKNGKVNRKSIGKTGNKYLTPQPILVVTPSIEALSSATPVVVSTLIDSQQQFNHEERVGMGKTMASFFYSHIPGDYIDAFIDEFMRLSLDTVTRIKRNYT
jgi:urease alpha subunit